MLETEESISKIDSQPILQEASKLWSCIGTGPGNLSSQARCQAQG